MQKKKSLTKWTLGAGLAAVAALAGAQFIQPPGGPVFYDRSFGVELAVQQLMAHSRLVEAEVLMHKREIEQFKKDLAAEKEKAEKLEKRVRNMELRGK